MTPRLRADEEGSMEEELMIGPAAGRRCWQRLVVQLVTVELETTGMHPVSNNAETLVDV